MIIGMLNIVIKRAIVIVNTASFGGGVREQVRSLLLHVHSEAPL